MLVLVIQTRGVVLLCLWATAAISLLDLDQSLSQLDSAKFENTTGRVENKRREKKEKALEPTLKQIKGQGVAETC